MAPVCRSYRKRTVDLAGTRYTMCCSFRTAPTDGFHLDIPKDGKTKAMEYYCWRLMQRDGRA